MDYMNYERVNGELACKDCAGKVIDTPEGQADHTAWHEWLVASLTRALVG